MQLLSDKMQLSRTSELAKVLGLLISKSIQTSLFNDLFRRINDEEKIEKQRVNN